MKLYLQNTDKFRFTDEGHIHEILINGAWQKRPGCTSISGLFPEDGWKFAWPPKLMGEYLSAQWLPDIAYSKVQIDQAIKDGKNAWRQKRDKSADIGTLTHLEIQRFIKTREMPFLAEKEVMNAFAEFLKWEEANKPEWLASEIQVGSLKNEFCGILDAVAVINGKTVLIDFKTSASIKDDYAIQLAGLHICLDEMGFIPESMAILHIPKAGKHEFRPITSDLEADKQAFLAGLEFYKHKNLFQARNK